MSCAQSYTTVCAEGNTAQTAGVFFFGRHLFSSVLKEMNRRICWLYKTRSVRELTDLAATHCGPQAGTYAKNICVCMWTELNFPLQLFLYQKIKKFNQCIVI